LLSQPGGRFPFESIACALARVVLVDSDKAKAMKIAWYLFDAGFFHPCGGKASPPAEDQ
jgi:hypothetical protein